MRFITEFELDGTKFDQSVMPYRKTQGEAELGSIIAKCFNWDHKGCTTLAADASVKEKFTLEIEAFPMDKWLKFKDGLIECISQAKENNYPTMFALLSIGNLLKELESQDVKQKLPG